MPSHTLAPFDPKRVAPWYRGAGTHGVLLLHGFTSTPIEMRGLGEHLHRRGYRCAIPALPGHATTPQHLQATRWHDWVESALHEVDILLAECSSVAIVGQSMGGNIALHVAALRPRIGAVATIGAPLRLHDARITALPVMKHIIRWHTPGHDVDLHSPQAVADLDSYGKWPTAAILELSRLLQQTEHLLPCIRQPVLLLHGGHDRTVSPSNAAELEHRLTGSTEVHRTMYWRDGHALTVDTDKESVYTEIAEWLKRHLGTPEAAGTP
ncbi:MAG: alpha/beta hydrolase [Candidatus Dormibacteria bacterium]